MKSKAGQRRAYPCGKIMVRKRVTECLHKVLFKVFKGDERGEQIYTNVILRQRVGIT